MRFLALEANIRKLKKRFMVEGEEELLSSTRHVFAFLIPMMWIVPSTAVVFMAWATAAGAGFDIFAATAILFAWGVFALGMALHGFIEWRYNFIVVTTEKIVIVDHRFVFSQSIRPVPLENIATTDVGSQYLGLGHCGFVNLHLSEVEKGTNKEFRLDRLPKPDVIAGVIENARSLKSQRAPADKGTAGQSEKVEEIQEKSTNDISTDATGAPPPPPPPPPPDQSGEEEAPAPRRVVLSGQGGLAYLPDGEVVEVVQANDELQAPASAPAGGSVTADVFDAQPGSDNA